jgi:hypothetical protein
MKWQGQFVPPPRPEHKVHPSTLGYYERKGWVVQAKKNGTSNLVTVRDGEPVDWVNRRGEPHKQWAPTPASKKGFQGLDVGGPCVFLTELLHSKVSGGPRDTHYLFDVLVYDGEWLVGTTYAQRYEILLRHFLKDSPSMEWSHFVVTPKLWLARNRRPGEDYQKLFQRLDKPEDEGLVLKDPAGRLAREGHPGWAVKSRRQTKNLGF